MRVFRCNYLIALAGLCLLASSGLTPAEEPAADQAAEAAEGQWQSLFDGESLEGWQVLDERTFKNHGQVAVADETIVLEAGSPATGIRATGEVPRIDYEIELEAQRVEGGDFFCGLTFPVGESPCTLIVGGWGGGVVGLSNVDDRHAEENETMRYIPFKNGVWHRIRLRVTEERIQAWIDDEVQVNLATKDRKFSVWWEQEPAVPLGIATWYTKAALRNVRLRQLTEEDLAWRPLFDGRSLEGWKRSDFGTAGDVRVEQGRIVLGFADGCNGITWQGEFPTRDYEIRLQAQRVDGTDFFCGLTFPVGDDPCSLIVGGWGGSVVGLSSLDGEDAAHNETRRVMGFSKGRWYTIRLRVAAGRITAWIDDEQVVDIATEGRKIGIRPEVEESRPLGICSWCTTAALRNIEWRGVAEPEGSDVRPADAP
jgi:hypothetical protein